jgi:hypothetical protein
MPGGLSPELLKDRRFRIKKLQFNTYEVDHPTVKGQLRILNVPAYIMEVPEGMIPPQAQTPGLPNYAIVNQNVVSFSNSMKKGSPSNVQYGPQEIAKLKKQDITSYAQDSSFEPWNEFVVEGAPAIMIKQKTVLAKLELLIGIVNQFGDPSLLAGTSVNNAVSIATTGEAGLS